MQKKKNNQKLFFCHVEYCLHRAQSLFLHSGSAVLTSGTDAAESSATRPSAAPTRTEVSWKKKKSYSVFVLLADLLQQLPVDELELHADGHLGDELVAALLRHLLAAAQVDVADASTALEIGQRLVGDPVAD